MATISSIPYIIHTHTHSHLTSPPTTVPPVASSFAAPQRSPWHSPVPYLFGGLAAMLGLIAFALLILACSYWKLSGQFQNHPQSQNRDLENGEKQSDSVSDDTLKVYEPKILVIMAGDDNPTFLATPVCSKSSSLANGIQKGESDDDGHGGAGDNSDKPDKEMHGDEEVQVTIDHPTQNP